VRLLQSSICRNADRLVPAALVDAPKGELDIYPKLLQQPKKRKTAFPGCHRERFKKSTTQNFLFFNKIIFIFIYFSVGT
jgi:hypothetical protein